MKAGQELRGMLLAVVFIELAGWSEARVELFLFIPD